MSVILAFVCTFAFVFDVVDADVAAVDAALLSLVSAVLGSAVRACLCWWLLSGVSPRSVLETWCSVLAPPLVPLLPLFASAEAMLNILSSWWMSFQWNSSWSSIATRDSVGLEIAVVLEAVAAMKCV